MNLLDTINVIDIESTCWDGKTPEGMISEIIEIVICTLDINTLTPIDKLGIMVKPARSTISEFCASLTTITHEDVDKGASFEEACKILRTRYKSNQLTWASYGNYDRLQFEKQCKLFDGDYPFGNNHMNVKNIFALVSGLSRETGMHGALSKLKIPLIGIHHRGVDDAYNIAMILSNLLRNGRPTIRP